MINILVLAAGSSTRFTGYDTPKQFLRFRNRGDELQYPMWYQAQKSLWFPKNIFVAIRTDHFQQFYDDTYCSEAKVLTISRTNSQCETFWFAMNQLERIIDTRQDLLVLNCDAGYDTGYLAELVLAGRAGKKVACMTFEAGPEEANRWSFVDRHPHWMRCEEKRYLPGGALSGAYYFPDFWEIQKASHQLANKWIGLNPPELYLSHILNEIPGTKLSCRMPRIRWNDWGTKEAFETYLAGQVMENR